MIADQKHAYFRAGVGIVVFNAGGRVLACERADHAGSWQLPQGGLRAGEEPREAAYRELEEETGIREDRVEFLDEYPEWLAYELPPGSRDTKKGRGQVQRWFLFRFHGGDSEIRLGHEFRAWKWMKLQDLAATTAAFRRPVYKKLARAFAR
jgi:putative (di)nucleoside polyphosphate hydrolase